MTRYRHTPEDKRALAWCNKIRAKLGMWRTFRIRKGIPQHAHKCPLARTIGNGVSIGVGIYDHEDNRIETIPSDVISWLEAFDSGKLPHFIAKGESHA